MNNFEFQNSTKIIFGKNTQNLVGEEVKKYSKKVLFHYGGESIKKSGLYNAVCDSLKESGVEFVELGGVKPNPRLSLVREGIEICKKENIDFILSVGGGSVIDSAKAIAIGVKYEGDVWDFYTAKAEAKEALPVGVILTIAATGSESSPSSVITDDINKRAYGNKIMSPKFAILNPELTFTVSPYQTACGSADIMAHVMERYFTQVNHTEFTDRLCEATLKTIINNLRKVLKNPNNYDARAEIMWAGTIAHNNLLSTGRIGDWGSHKIEHELSGIYDVSHGAGLTVIFPAWMTYVYKLNINRFIQFAINVWDVDITYEDPEEIAKEGIKRMKNFFSEIGMPVSLKELNIPTDRIAEMSKHACIYGPLGAFKKLYEEDVKNIFNLAK
jgi:alcohol dehydrogenase YqhD (iron-dependent ADH family)